MASYVTCNICKETISYAPGDVWKLGYHLRTQHSKSDVAHFASKDARGTEQNSSERKRKMYKTTVETWNCGTTELFCPRCKKACTPLIRKQRNKVARSSVGALCLLGCWPLCFLPFMIGRGHIMNAYCRDCGLLLGTVNRKTATFQPAQTSIFVDVPKICGDSVTP